MPTVYNNKAKISTLFLDIGGVLLSNGWDHTARAQAASIFNLDLDKMQQRHSLFFDAYESGMLRLDEYLQHVIFYEKRSFSKEKFLQFMYDQSKPLPKMIQLITKLKNTYKLKVIAVNNEGLELNEYRIKTFNLGDTIDYFVSSCFVHLKKPNPAMFRLALTMAQVPANQVLYIDDRALFIEVAKSLNINGIHHTNHDATRIALDHFGLKV